MSGVEVLAVLGATSSVITICETCAASVRFIQECQPTEATAMLKPQVDLLANVITQLKSLHLDSPAHGLDAVLAGFEKELQNLQNLIEDYLKASSTPLLKRARKYFKIPIWERKIQKNWTRIQQYQQNISFFLDFYNTKRLLNASRTEASLFLVPFQRPIHFVGRQDIFSQISHYINHSTQHPCMLSLTGMGGIGKTEIARELCHRERPTYPVIIWFVAVNETSFKQSVLNFANKLSTGQWTFNNYQDSLAYIQDVAKNRIQPWLFVFDDWEVSNQNFDPFNILVDGGQRDVIVTTTRHPGSSRGIQIQVPPFSEKNAVQFLLGSSLSSSLDEVEAARILARESGYLPLALSQMRGYMESSGITIRELLELWGKKKKDLESIEQMNNGIAIDTVFDLAIQGVKREDSRLLDFLLQLSFIAAPVEFMFRDHFLVAQSRAESLPSFYQLFVHNKQWSSELFLHAVMQLSMSALVREELVGDSGVMVLSSHRLVKRVLQNEASRINLDLQLMLQATAIIAAPLTAHDWEELSFYPGSIFRERILQSVEHRRSVINSPELIKRYSGISEGYQTSLAAFLAMYSNEEKQARNLLLQSLSLQSTWLGESASLTCTTMTWLTLLYLESMSLDEAEVMIDRLNSAESQVSKPQKTPLVDMQFLKGHLQMRKQNIDHAVSIFEHCTDLYAKISGISSVSTASALVSGVEAMLMQGNVEDATQNLYDAERIQKEIGSPRALAIRVKWNLARHSLRMGDHIRASSRYKDLCEEHETNQNPIGSLSRRWESLRCELGDVYLDLGDIQKANTEYDTGRASASRRSRKLKIDSGGISQWLIYGSLERTKFVPLLGF